MTGLQLVDQYWACSVWAACQSRRVWVGVFVLDTDLVDHFLFTASLSLSLSLSLIESYQESGRPHDKRHLKSEHDVCVYKAAQQPPNFSLRC